MTNSIVLVGSNLVADTPIRKKLAGRDTGVELQIVLEDLLNSWDTKADNKDGGKTGTVTVEKQEEGGCDKETNPDQYLPRDQLKITLKIFLQEADVMELDAAVTAALAKLSTNR